VGKAHFSPVHLPTRYIQDTGSSFQATQFTEFKHTTDRKILTLNRSTNFMWESYYLYKMQGKHLNEVQEQYTLFTLGIWQGP